MNVLQCFMLSMRPEYPMSQNAPDSLSEHQNFREACPTLLWAIATPMAMSLTLVPHVNKIPGYATVHSYR